MFISPDVETSGCQKAKKRTEGALKTAPLVGLPVFRSSHRFQPVAAPATLPHWNRCPLLSEFGEGSGVGCMINLRASENVMRLPCTYNTQTM
jgi:hypothetical protein